MPGSALPCGARCSWGRFYAPPTTWCRPVTRTASDSHEAWSSSTSPATTALPDSCPPAWTRTCARTSTYLASTPPVRSKTWAPHSALEPGWQELRTKLGPAHPWVLGLALTLSGSRCTDGDGDGAAELSGTAQEKSATSLGARHPVTLLLTVAHAADLRALGRIERADELDSLARRELGQHHTGHPQTQAVTEGKRPVWEFEPLPLHVTDTSARPDPPPTPAKAPDNPLATSENPLTTRPWIKPRTRSGGSWVL